MPALNYAERWQPGLLAILNQNTLTSPFITSNVKWLDAKSFHFTQMSVSGYRNHKRDGGFNRGNINQTDVVYTLTHDRDIEFFIDKADVDETNQTASAENISHVFEKTRVAPETDAYFFAKVAKAAINAGLVTKTAISDYTKANVLTKVKALFKHGRLRAYKQDGSLIMYVSSDIMDLLEMSSEIAKKIEITQIADGGTGIETRVANIDGVPIIEVIDLDRFYDNFEFIAEGTDTLNGFVPAKATYVQAELASGDSLVGLYTKSGNDYTLVNTGTYSSGTYYKKIDGAHKINVLAASVNTTFTVPKINSIYFFAPGEHTQGDGYVYQNRSLWDTFVFPNGLTGKIDSIAVDIDTEDYKG